jgi:hypothetical protein
LSENYATTNNAKTPGIPGQWGRMAALDEHLRTMLAQS